ncbi:bifunctional folylpolyglutamate synthase/dihydrofolate synthase [Paenibacillus sacheonensis]|uniref:Dihydrofolate synthase/folylpolyglutamate synthase n=1 Tax=Paenibacillus sacheonensis TaxID=742054 RepID=A0A7X5BUY4_9BACL|nr:folylpolyglutamate synthase/dihydrofolate synthase family protein [Paenibacillus sacheonensis]MBM7563787.1 dihydrofolate synthase/folylpolyglutamate synthase [Paenibacillus sacheonensis]NBC67863.1 bifunctional folylpolyglutamate synthase/dihydrofolate synthase [Paenibacillus sacheonensis]
MNEQMQEHQNRPLASYEEARQWIEGLVPFGIRPGMERIRKLMEMTGHPERRIKFIHVAGTNGKGSVCAYLTSVLLRCGYDVGTFTSPYITKFTNRFQYNGTDIPEETLLALANRLKPLVEEIAATELGSPSMFEVSTALAILYYGTVSYPDFVVWETGLGGRLDVTNVVTPIVSVITNVGHDHMDILGDTLEEIAAEKAGIIKAGVPVISAVSQPEAAAIIRETAKAKNSSLYMMGDQFHEVTLHARENEQSFRFDGIFRSIDDLAITLNGAHQRSNAAVAVMTLEVLRQYYALILEDEDLREGLRNAAWPGRLEMIGDSPRVLIDGAHNPEGAQMLAEALKDTYAYEHLHLMIGMLANKNHRDALRHILPLVNTLIVTEADFRKALPASSLATLVQELREEEGYSFELIVEPDWKQALARLQQSTGKADLAVVTGTLYLIADVRSKLLYNTDSEKGW